MTKPLTAGDIMELANFQSRGVHVRRLSARPEVSRTSERGQVIYQRLEHALATEQQITTKMTSLQNVRCTQQTSCKAAATAMQTHKL